MTRRQIRPGAGVYDCSLKEKREQSLHSVCISLSSGSVGNCESWLSSKRTTGLSFDDLACAVKCFTYLTKRSSVTYPDGRTVC